MKNKSVSPQELEVMFSQGAPIRGLPIDVKPSFKERVKLYFSKNFQITAGGHPIKSTPYGRAKAIFSKKFQVKKSGSLIGRGIFEVDLIKMGFTKKELSNLVESGLLSKTTVSWKSSWRTVYVCHMKVTEEEISKHGKRPKK